MGRNPNAMQDSMHMQVNHRSINLLDFERNQEKDLFLVDVNSDRSQFGGITETELSIQKDGQGDTFCMK